MRKYFPAIIEKDTDSDYGIYFPDFPGCVSAGSSAEAAIAGAAEALSGHVALMVEDGDTLPDPTPVEDVRADPGLSVVSVTLIPVVIPAHAKRINITLDEGLLGEIDEVAGNRSRFLADAARAELARRRSA